MRVKLEDAVEEYLESIENDAYGQPTKGDQRIPIRYRRHNPIPRWLLPLTDVLLAFVTFGLAYFLRYELNIFRPVLEINRAPFVPYLPFAAVYAAFFSSAIMATACIEPCAWPLLDGRNLHHHQWCHQRRHVILLALFFVFQPLVFSRLMLLYVAAITIVLLALARTVYRMVLAESAQ